MNSMNYHKEAFNSVGWFIPPYVTMGFLSFLAKTINDSKGSFEQKNLEDALSVIYSAENLAAMVISRYPITPYVSDFSTTISEAVEAHFMGLSHVAVSGLLPAIEGIALSLASNRSVKSVTRGVTFKNLAEHCKQEVLDKNIGAVGEVISMIDSFIVYTESQLYLGSSEYKLSDKTNRHGILHGAYADKDYGEPINFYKAISAIDFLCFISAIRASISWFAPSHTDHSRKLAIYYHSCSRFTKLRPTN